MAIVLQNGRVGATNIGPPNIHEIYKTDARPTFRILKQLFY